MLKKNWDFRGILIQLRKKRGLTQAQLGQRAGIAPAAISHFETGLRKPSPENLHRLGDALGVTVDYLLGRQHVPKPSGKEIQAVFRHAQDMSTEALEELEDLAKLVAERDRKKRQKSEGSEG